MAWWESWFGEEYLDLYPYRDQASARRETAFAAKELGPNPRPILDLCCGSGLHSAQFAERDLVPVGLDYSAPLLELARARSKDLKLVRGDMRQLPFADASFRSVVNFFTSFGYFVDETDNRAVVQEIERVLARGGRFLCDTFSLDYVLSRLVPEESRATPAREYSIRRAWNPATRRIEKQIEVRRGGSSQIFRESVRAYKADELARMFEEAGLCVRAMWGDFDGRPLGAGCPRLIVLADKR